MNIKTLQRRSQLTGADVGRALIACALHDIRHAGDANYKLLLTQEDFRSLERKLVTQEDLRVYELYKDLHCSLLVLQNTAQGYMQNMLHGLSKYYDTLHSCISAEEEKRLAPLILSPEQYERAQEAARNRKEKALIRPREVLFHILKACLNNIHDAPAPIRRQLRKEDQREAGTEEAYKKYNSITKRGHNLSKDERASVLERNMNRNCKLLFMGSDSIRSFYKELTGSDIEESSGEVIEEAWRDATLLGRALGSRREKSLAERFLAEIEPQERPLVFQESKDTPSMSRLKLIQDCVAYYEQEGLSALRKDYPDLYKELAAYMLAKVPDIRGMKPQQYRKASLLAGDIARMNFAGAADLTKPNNEDIAEEVTGESATRRKIAVWTGEGGEQKFFMKRYRLEEIDKQPELKRTLRTCQKMARHSLRAIYAHNALLDILGRVYGLEGIEYAHVNTDAAERQIDRINTLVYFKSAFSATKEERERWKEIFYHFDKEGIEPDINLCAAIEENFRKTEFSPEAKKLLHPLIITRLISKIAKERQNHE